MYTVYGQYIVTNVLINIAPFPTQKLEHCTTHGVL